MWGYGFGALAALKCHEAKKVILYAPNRFYEQAYYYDNQFR